MGNFPTLLQQIKEEDVNEIKLENLLKQEPGFESYALDRCTNLEYPPEVPSKKFKRKIR